MTLEMDDLRSLRAHALTVACPRLKCQQPAGVACINPTTGLPLTGQPGHLERERLADHTAAMTVDCPADRGGCGQTATNHCLDPATNTWRDQRHPDCEIRLRRAGVYRYQLDQHELAGTPHSLNPDEKLRRGRAEWTRSQREQRLAELRANDRANDISQAERAELLDLDRLLADDPAAPPVPAQRADDEPTEADVLWLHGPHDPRHGGGHRR